METSFMSTFRSVITMFVGLSWSNTQQLSAVIWGADTQNSAPDAEGNVSLSTARFLSMAIFSIFILFSYSSDAIVVAR